VKVGQFPWGNHSPATYRGRVAYIKNLRMKGKVSVFASGKLISVGTRSEEEAKRNIATACQLLDEVGLIESKKLRVKIQNIVILAQLGTELDLEIIAKKLSHIIYEPEQFPGAILRTDKYPTVTSIVFSSGKLVIAGAKSAASAKVIARYIIQLLKENLSAILDA